MIAAIRRAVTSPLFDQAIMAIIHGEFATEMESERGRKRRLSNIGMEPKLSFSSRKWNRQGLRWLRIGPKSRVIMNAVYDFFVLGHEDPTYANND